MKKASLFDRSGLSTTSPSGARHIGARSQRAYGETVELRNSASDSTALNAAGLDRALEVSRARLQAALCRIDAIEAESLLLKHQIALLQRSVAQTRRFACHDELTGLPNRRLLVDRYNQAVALAQRQGRRVGLLFLDLDDFKKVNDVHGHAAGDSILRQVAERLRACIRTADTACRYGGDEFIVLLTALAGRESALAAARKIRARLAVPCIVDGVEIRVTASIGMAVYPLDGNEFGDLMRITDGLMYRDKARDAACRATPLESVSEA
jgi:diguanylate cyclase (GGDEF)-like protein